MNGGAMPGTVEPFRPFGQQHLAALALTVVVSFGVAFWLRRDRPGRGWSCRALAAAILASGAASVVLELSAGTPWRQYAPLQLCDLSVLLAAVALVTRGQLVFELTYFWGGAGSTLALLTPDLAEGFPHRRFIVFFAQHGGIAMAAVVLAVGLGLRPRPRAPWIALAWINAYAALLLIVNVAVDANFMYLRAKPRASTLLDWLGPWPLYILVAELVAVALWWAMMLPFRLTSEAAAEPPAPPRRTPPR